MNSTNTVQSNVQNPEGFTAEQWTALAVSIHEDNVRAGWWSDLETGERLDRDWDEVIALIHSELSEALEGERKGLMDDKLPHRKMAEVEMADVVIRLLDACQGFDIPLGTPSKGSQWWHATFVTRNTAACINSLHRSLCSLDTRFASLRDPETTSVFASNLLSGVIEYCNKFGYDLLGAIQEKREFNKNRPDHQRENRLRETGKKF